MVRSIHYEKKKSDEKNWPLFTIKSTPHTTYTFYLFQFSKNFNFVKQGNFSHISNQWPLWRKLGQKCYCWRPGMSAWLPNLHGSLGVLTECFEPYARTFSQSQSRLNGYHATRSPEAWDHLKIEKEKKIHTLLKEKRQIHI